MGDEDGDDELQLWLPEVGSSPAVFDPSPATWSTLKAVTKLGRAGEWRGKRGIDWGTGRDRRVYRFSRVFVSSVRSAVIPTNGGRRVQPELSIGCCDNQWWQAAASSRWRWQSTGAPST